MAVYAFHVEADRLRNSPVGVLVPISGFEPRRATEYHHVAFLPAALPAAPEFASATWAQVTEAAKALARLDQAGRQIPNPGLLRRPLMRREAVSTSALEGTHAAFTDVLEADILGGGRSPEVREVLNYIAAADHAIAAVLEGRPITIGLLNEAHALLVRGTRADGPDAGRLRSGQVVIGPAECAVVDARFVPVPADDRLAAGVASWESWVRAPRALPAIVEAALAHYQFETLHPYNDGNGRLGRLVVLLQLLARGELGEALLEVSPWFEARRTAYQDELLNVSITGDFDRWVRFFTGGLGSQASATVERIDRLLAVHGNLVAKARTVGKGLVERIAEGTLEAPYVTARSVTETHRVSRPAANTALAKLVSAGILREVSGRAYGRLYAATDVIEALITP